MLLPATSKVREVEHHASLAWEQIPDFMVGLGMRAGTAPRALAFAILCASRSGEVRGARWREFDMLRLTWTIPAARTKQGREHVVPISEAAAAILHAVTPPAPARDALVFPGTRLAPLSDMSLLAVLRRMDVPATPHGFRSSFRSWCADHGHDREVAETALGHVAGSVERSYQRSALLARRRELMEAWAAFATTPAMSATKATAA